MSKRPKTQKELSIEKGKNTLIAIFVYLLIMEIANFFLVPVQGADAYTTPTRWVITFLISYQLYHGKMWAKALLSFSLGVGTLMSAYALFIALSTPNTPPANTAFIFLFTVLPFAYATYILLFSSDINEFILSEAKKEA